MQKYYIFLLKEEVYRDYFYKTGLLNRFFHAYLFYPKRNDLKKQFNYITRHIPVDLSTSIQNNLAITSPVGNPLQSNNHLIDGIAVKERWIEIKCESLAMASLLLYQWLEQIERSCFVIEQNGERHGWLSPLKKNSRLEVMEQS